MFGNKDKKIKNTRTMEINVVTKNTTIIGDIKSEGDFRIDGTLEGTLKTNGKVIIGSEGAVKGNVEAANADIEGKFSGQLLVDKMLTIKASANISGEVVINKLSVEPGATFNATCSMKGSIKALKNDDYKANSKGKTAEKTA